jgi:hypothetical protein
MLVWILLWMIGFGGLALIGVRHLLWPRCHIYVYVRIRDRRVPVRVGYVRLDGTLIDLSRPAGRRRIGTVTVRRDGLAWVRLDRLELGDDKAEDVGYATPEGEVCLTSGDGLGSIDPEGSRRWWELWLRCHADVPSDADEPDGKCVETGRWRRRFPNQPTMLVRGAAAFLLHRFAAQSDEEVPTRPPGVLWDTALPAAAVFAVPHLHPRFPAVIDAMPLAFLRTIPYPYLVKGMLAFVLCWGAVYLAKRWWLAENNLVLTHLMMLNRQTGLRRWTTAGWVASGLLCGISLTAPGWTTAYTPLYAAALVGFVAATRGRAEPWPVKPRSPRPPAPAPVPPPQGAELREYDWRLDSALRDLRFHAEVGFEKSAVDAARGENPFSRDPAAASANWRAAARTLVKQGEAAPQVRFIASVIAERSRAHDLTPFEEIQAALDFVQEPNIVYAHDWDSPELGGAREYWRYPLETMYDKRGDCDCKAILAAALMRSLQYPVVLLVSDAVRHAAIAVGGAPPPIASGLAVVRIDGEDFYFCETTGDHWTVGQPTPAAQRMLADPGARLDLRE